MFSLLSFTITDPGGANPTICQVQGDQLDVGGVDIPLSVLDNHRDEIAALLGQPRSTGEHHTQGKVAGGPTVTYARPDEGDPSLDTVVLAAGLQPFSRAKVEGGYLAALLAFGLISPA